MILYYHILYYTLFLTKFKVPILTLLSTILILFDFFDDFSSDFSSFAQKNRPPKADPPSCRERSFSLKGQGSARGARRFDQTRHLIAKYSIATTAINTPKLKFLLIKPNIISLLLGYYISPCVPLMGQKCALLGARTLIFNYLTQADSPAIPRAG